jgi:hypothetical protein
MEGEGGRSVLIEAGYGLELRYLSPDLFETAQLTIEHAHRNVTAERQKRKKR